MSIIFYSFIFIKFIKEKEDCYYSRKIRKKIYYLNKSILL